MTGEGFQGCRLGNTGGGPSEGSSWLPFVDGEVQRETWEGGGFPSVVPGGGSRVGLREDGTISMSIDIREGGR